MFILSRQLKHRILRLRCLTPKDVSDVPSPSSMLLSLTPASAFLLFQTGEAVRFHPSPCRPIILRISAILLFQVVRFINHLRVLYGQHGGFYDSPADLSSHQGCPRTRCSKSNQIRNCQRFRSQRLYQAKHR